MSVILRFCVIAVCLIAMTSASNAATKHFLLTESDPGGLNNVFLREFADLDALKSLTQSTTSNLEANSTQMSSINGLTWAGDRFLMLVEADPGLSGVFLKEFSTLADVRSATTSRVTFLGNNLGGSGVSIGGLTWDGSKLYMITESDPGPNSLGSLRLREFNSIADLRALNQATSTLLGNHVGGTGVSTVGLDFDGSDWRLITESDPGPNSLGSLRLRTFDTLADLKSLNQQTTSLLGNNVGGTGVSTHAYFSFDDSVPPNPGVVPAPTSFPLLASGLIGFFVVRRRTNTLRRLFPA